MVSWWGRPDVDGTADSQGVNTDLAVPLVIAAAERSWLTRRDAADDARHAGANADDNARATSASRAGGGGMHIAFHLEPYPGRTAASVKADVAYLAGKYGDSKVSPGGCTRQRARNQHHL